MNCPSCDDDNAFIFGMKVVQEVSIYHIQCNNCGNEWIEADG